MHTYAQTAHMHTVHVWYNKSLSVIYSNVTPRFLCNAEL